MKRIARYAIAAAMLLAVSVAHASTPLPSSGADGISTVKVELQAGAFAPEKLKAEIYLPPGYQAHSTTRYPVLYFNDGQDAAAVGVQAMLEKLYAQRAIDKVIVVAIVMLPDRMGTYGLSDRRAGHSVAGGSRYGDVGARADEYSELIVGQLVPYIDAHYRTRPDATDRTILGWSLGALNAFNLGWQYPDVFGRVGAFSPSFWLASDRTDAASVQNSRLAQRMVQNGLKRTGSKFWFAVGTAEETDDRDGDGIIDAVDDTRDLAEALGDLGYSYDPDYRSDETRRAGQDADVSLYLLPAGQHNQSSWARMLPLFLTWAYGDEPAAAR